MEIAPLQMAQAKLRCDAMERRVNSRCKGLLEIHGRAKFSLTKHAADTLASSEMPVLYQDSREVDFLHRTVRDFLSTPTASMQLVAQDGVSFQASIVMLRALLARLKTVNRLKTRVLNLKQLWKFVEPAIESARTAERLDPVSTAIILKELDRTASILYIEIMTGRHSQSLKVLNRSPRVESPIESTLWSQWSNSRLTKFGEPSWADPSWTSFLTFAMENGLESFVAQELSQQEGLLHKMRGPPLLLMTFSRAEIYSQSAMTSTYQRLPPGPGMMRLLFEHGADPNQYFQGHTVWERVLFWQAKDKLKWQYLWNEAVEVFQLHGTDACITKSPSGMVDRIQADEFNEYVWGRVGDPADSWSDTPRDGSSDGEDLSHMEEFVQQTSHKHGSGLAPPSPASPQVSKMSGSTSPNPRSRRNRINALLAAWNPKKARS